MMILFDIPINHFDVFVARTFPVLSADAEKVAELKVQITLESMMCKPTTVHSLRGAI